MVTEKWEAEDLIKQAIQRHKPNIYVAFSGGKGSEVVLHLALKHWKKIPVVFHNTGVEFPETVSLVHKLRDEWELNLIETHPEKTFWDCIKEYGFPGFKTGKRSRPKCCYHLKEKPTVKAEKEHGLVAVFTGIQGSESYYRRRVIRFCGQRYLHKKTNVWRYHPIAHWTDEDIWNYIKGNKLPFNQAYLLPRCDRTGCMPCTCYKGWREKLAVQNPKLYKLIAKMKGEPTLQEWMSGI